jgi:hypothetical protein
MFLKFDPYRVWCSIFYSKLINCILFKIIVQYVRFMKGRGTCGSGERNFKILIDFRKSPRFSFTALKSTEREVESPCFYYVWWALNNNHSLILVSLFRVNVFADLFIFMDFPILYLHFPGLSIRCSIKYFYLPKMVFGTPWF